MDDKPERNTQEYWDKKSAELGDDPHFTLPDYNLRGLEAEYIIRHLEATDEALDMGCSNGTTTVRFAKYVKHIVGGDYAPATIEKAKKLHPGGNIDYRVMDVSRIEAEDARFDVVITERCLINLPDWPSQQAAIREIARVLKPGGRYLMCESFAEAFVQFAEMRTRFGLEPMKRHWHNCLLKEAHLRDFLPEHFRILSVEKMGIYYLISRLLHPILVSPEEPVYEAEINQAAVRLCLELDSAYMNDISVNGLYVLEKM